RGVALDPAIDRRMVDRNAAFRQHFLKVAIADRIATIPAHRPQDHITLEMAPLEIRHRSVRPISAKHAQASRFLQQSHKSFPGRGRKALYRTIQKAGSVSLSILSKLGGRIMTALTTQKILDAEPSDREAVLARARELGQALKERAHEIEQAKRIPQDVADALVEAGLFHITVPKAMGGLGLSPTVPWEAAIEIGRGCAA